MLETEDMAGERVGNIQNIILPAHPLKVHFVSGGSSINYEQVYGSIWLHTVLIALAPNHLHDTYRNKFLCRYRIYMKKLILISKVEALYIFHGVLSQKNSD